MSDNTFNAIANGIRRMGLPNKGAWLNPEDESIVVVKMTPLQFERLQETVPGTTFGGTDDGYILAHTPKDALEKALSEKKSAPRRAGGVNVKIESRMIYDVQAPDATNVITYAEWDSSNGVGFIEIEGAKHDITTGIAADYASDDYEGDPERTVYIVTLTGLDPETDDLVTEDLTAYGVTNLIRRVCSFPYKVQ